MKWHIHRYQHISGCLKDKVISVKPNGRYVKTLFLERCIKCGKERWWGFGREWVWNGESSFAETLNKINKDLEEMRKRLDKK